MRKTMLVVASLAIAMLVAGGVAWAATLQCPTGKNYHGTPICRGTARADTMLGTANGDGSWWGYAGGDTLYGRGGGETMYGSEGPDKLYGGPGRDKLVGEKGVDKLFGGPGPDYLRPDNDPFGGYPADDYVHGGIGDDLISADWAIGGVDRIYGEDGNDHIEVSQRSIPEDVPVSKAIVDCGPGAQDEVVFDEGVDVIKNCEIKHPV
jgi:Ca2+-binding RTX toxin-like protein